MSELGPDQIANNWGVIASDYELAFQGLSSQFAAATLGLLDLKSGERVLDVAAGTGAFSLLAARAGADVLATDFAPGMVEQLRRRISEARLTNITAEVMDGQALAVPDTSFDASVSVLGLIFFPDIAKGFTELRRVLRPGGRAAIVCWSDPRSLQLMILVMQAIRKVDPTFEPPASTPVWARLAGAEKLRAQMQDAGFRNIEVTTSTGVLKIESPETWERFTRSVPPLAFLFQRLGPEKTAAVGHAYMESLIAASGDGSATVSAEACIGVGRV
jgi:ubiquinone/menaquinone biosynthesis C-methylase UbiE